MDCDLKRLYLSEKVFFFLVRVLFDDFHWVKSESKLLVFSLKLIWEVVNFVHKFVAVLMSCWLTVFELLLEHFNLFLQQLNCEMSTIDRALFILLRCRQSPNLLKEGLVLFKQFSDSLNLVSQFWLQIINLVLKKPIGLLLNAHSLLLVVWALLLWYLRV